MTCRKIIALFGAFLLTGTACGGSTDSAGDQSSAGDVSTAGDEHSDSSAGDNGGDEESDASTLDVGDHFDTAGGVATATVGAETWEFVLDDGIPIVNCDADFFGGFVAILVNEGADFSAPYDQFHVQLPGGDFTDPPVLNLNLGSTDGLEWIADETIYEQNSDLPAGIGVTSFTIDGNTATGSGLFFEQESYYQFNAGTGELLLEEGTFTVTCAEDG